MRPHRCLSLRHALLIAALVAPAGSPKFALAVSRSWTNAAGGSVGTSSNWSPAAVPTAADNLVFPLGGTMNITFPSATVPLVISHDYRTGVYNISSDGTHTTTASFGVGQSTSSGVNMTGGTFQLASVLAGNSSGSYGRLTLRPGSGFPAPAPPALSQTDSTQGGHYGMSGNARLEILGGSTQTLAGGAIFGNSAGARCTLVVSGRNAVPLQNSTFRTTNPRRGTAQFGGFGLFVGSVDNGGVLRIAGDALMGLRVGASGVLTIGGSTTTLAPLFAAEKALRIGDSGLIGTGAGLGDLRLYKGSVLVGGPLTLGDPDGNTGSPGLRVEGGLLRASGGFTRLSQARYAHLGGLIHLEGGAISWPAFAWEVTSNLGSPELWISNGLTTSIQEFQIGRGGSGLLRISRPNTRVNSLESMVLGDSATGVGRIVLDSSAVMTIQTQLLVGNYGSGSITVKHGARLEPAMILTLGNRAGSSATGLVSGAGSLVTMNNRLDVGVAGSAVLTVDSAAVVEVTTNVGVANIGASGGHLVVRDGATFRAATLNLDGACDLRAATIDAAMTSIGAAGRLSGRGRLTGHLGVFGLLDLVPTAGELGALRVDSTAVLWAGSTLGVALGRGAGPKSDTLVCGGELYVYGTLALSADPSFLRVVGDTFVVATATNVSGSFAGVTWNGAPAAALFDVIVQPTRVLVVTKSATLGVGEGLERPGALQFRSVSHASRLAFALELPADAEVRVTLLDVTGREVARLHEGRLAAGSHTLAMPVANLPSGIYFARAAIGRDGVTSVRSAKAVHLR